MRTIYKYALDESSITFDIKIHAGGKILHVELDPLGVPCLWAEVETEGQLETRHFEIIGTGQEFPDDARERKHVGTFLQSTFVWHLYEVIIPE